MAANDPRRSGVEQLLRVLATVFVAGGEPLFERLLGKHSVSEPLQLGVPLYRPRAPLALAAAAPRPAPTTPLAAAFVDSLDAIEKAGAAILAAAQPRERRTMRTLSLSTLPELLDHSFYRQPPRWPVISDLHPVVPMTALVALMIDAARELAPGRVAVAVEDVHAFRWLAVSTPVAARFHARLVAPDRVAVTIEGFAEATVVLGEAYLPAPATTGRQRRPRPAPFPAPRLYGDRWLFHGPLYQGVEQLGELGDDGISGVLKAGRACGALLDNAGQLLGFWVMQQGEQDRLAMPVSIGRIDFFGPDPAPGARLDCDVRIRRFDERSVVADLELSVAGRVWARIEGWEDRRFETDARLWNILLFPERNLLAVPDGAGVVYDDHYRTAPTREQLERRFLGEAERAAYQAQPPRQQRAWLAARIAAKDAVRHHVWRRGAPDEPIWPVEIELSADGLRARFRGGPELAVDVIVDGDLVRATVDGKPC